MHISALSGVDLAREKRRIARDRMENRYMSNGAVPFETRINGEEEEEEVIIQERYDRAVNDRWRADTRSLLKRK